MIFAGTLALLMAQGTFAQSMNVYMACVQQRLPADFSQLDRGARIRIYRDAAAHCQSEREEAVAAAVRNRQPGETAEAARALAIDIIDTLDPGSN